MNIDERKEEMKKLRGELEVLVLDYNQAFQEGNVEKYGKLDSEITKKVNEYTALAKDNCFDECKAADDPMLEAVKRLTYQTIRAKDTKEGEDKIPVRTIEDTEKPIDPLKLHKYCKGIGKDAQWAQKIEKFNFLMTAKTAEDLGIDPTEIHNSYAMSDVAKNIKLGKNPTSNTQMIKTLSGIVAAMIGDEYKPVSHDVSYLKKIYCKKNRKALKVTCANHKFMRLYIMEICHRIVTNGRYDIDYKKAK